MTFASPVSVNVNNGGIVMETIKELEDSPTLKAEKERTALLEEQAKQAKARKEIRDASKSGIEVTPPEGKTEVDENVKIEATILAHKAMSDIANEIVTQIRKSGAKKVVVNREADLNTILLHRVFRSKITEYKKRYDELLKQPITTPLFASSQVSGALSMVSLTGVTTLAQEVIGLVSLFRTDVNVKGVGISPNVSALVAEIANRAKVSPSFDLFYPEVYPPESYLGDFKASTTLQELESLLSKREEGKDWAAKYQLALGSIERQLSNAQAVADKAKLTALGANSTQADKDAFDKAEKAFTDLQNTLQKEKLPLEAIQRRLTGVQGEVDAFLGELTKADEAKGTSLLFSLIKSEGLVKLATCSDCRDTYVLSLKVESAGGSNVTKRNLFTLLFTGDRLTHTGGSIVSYLLFDREGRVAQSGTLFDNQPRTKNQEIKRNFPGN